MMNNKTKKAIKEEIEVVRKEYPKKDAKSVLYLAIRHVIRRENPEISGRERYNLQKELFNEMEENKMIELNFNQIEGKLFSIVGIRHYSGINELMKDNNGIIVVENNNIILKNNDNKTVGSMLSSESKMNELIKLGIPKNALTKQETFKNKNISKNVFNNVKVTVEQHIPDVCVVIKIVEKEENKKEKKVGDNMVNITEEIKSNKDKAKVNISLNQLNESIEYAKENYEREWDLFLSQNLKPEDPIGSIINALRDIDSYISMRYLNEEVDISEYDHVRSYCTIQAYFLYQYCIEKIDFKDFFSPVTMLAEDKYDKEVNEYENL